MPNNERITVEQLYNCQITTVDILTEQMAKKLKRGVGTYISIKASNSLEKLEDMVPTGECLAKVLDQVLHPHYRGKLCICGMGNRNVTADALGPEVTYNLPLKLFSQYHTRGNFSEVCSFDPGTELTTNTKPETLVKGIVKEVGADCVLLVDSCMTKEADQLFRTIQLTTAKGISSYMAGRTVDWSALGVPVISLAVPVTIPASGLVSGERLCGEMLTSIMIHEVISAAASIIAYALMRVCWPGVPMTDCFILSKLNKDPLAYSDLLNNREKQEDAQTKMRQ